MANKTINLIILRSDRKLWDGGETELEVRDLRVNPAEKNPIKKRQSLPAETAAVLLNVDLLFNAGQVYSISIDADDHRAAWQLVKRRSFVRLEGGAEVEKTNLTMQLMLVPNDPSSSDLDEGYDALQSAGSPLVADETGLKKNDYLALEPAAKMAFLNLGAKLRDTRINGVSLLSFVLGVRLVRVDRLFLYMRSEIKQLIQDSADFASAPGHKAPKNVPVTLPAHPDSWKHMMFGAGNLQLSFSKEAEPFPANTTKQAFSVDADIDLERGLLHVAEFLDNKFIHPSRKTNQTLVYALLFSQGIITNYTLDPVKPA